MNLERGVNNSRFSVVAVSTAIILGFVINLLVGGLLLRKNKLELARAENESQTLFESSETIEALTNSINILKKGEKGEGGIDGANGTNGLDGTNGANGASGLNGANGTNGANGINGLSGENGEDGSAGVKGVQGDLGEQGITTGYITNLERTTQERTYYVNPSTGSDVSGDGTSSKPYATIQNTINQIPEKISHDTTIQLASGTYRE